MDKIGYFSNGLAEETLREAADTFFGKRKKIDEELELFFRQVKQVREKSDKVSAAAASFNYLLLDRETVEYFWKNAGLEQSIYAQVEPQWGGKRSLPWALTMRSRYQKIVLTFYEELQMLVDDYVHGKYIDHPEVKGKKILTSSLSLLKNWADELNREIEQINCSNRPDDVLAFTRRMDVNESSRRESVGSGLEYDYNELCFKPLDFNSLELKDYPELPQSSEIRGALSRTCDQILNTKKNQVKEMLAGI